MDSRETAESILRHAGFTRGDAQAAKKNLDRRLEGLGLGPSVGLPIPIPPGREVLRPTVPQTLDRILSTVETTHPRGSISALLVNPEGARPRQVVAGSDIEDLDSEALYEPSDMISAQAVTGLATTAAGGTEVRFNVRGYVHVGSGAIGVYWNRPLGASQGFRWVPLAPGLLIPYDPRQGLFVGSNAVGGITIGGVLTLSFYRLPKSQAAKGDDRAKIEAPGRTPGAGPADPGRIDPGAGSGSIGGSIGDSRVVSRQSFRDRLASRLVASGSDTTAGAIITGLGGGSDVTLGSFSDAGAGTQIYLAGSNMPVGGASVGGALVLNSRPANTDTIWVGETAALAVASNGPIGPSGQDTWNIPVSGKLFMLALSGTQILGARYRS